MQKSRIEERPNRKLSMPVGLVFVALLVLPVASLTADRVLIRVWDLQLHSSDIGVAIEEISEWVQEGYLPVGLEWAPGRPILVAYTQNINAPITEVSLYTIGDMEQLGPEMSRILREGLVPMGMARHEDGLTLLLVRTTIPIRNWGLVTVPFNLVAIESEIDRREAQGYSAWALSDYEAEAWLLFLQEAPNAPRRIATVQSYLFDADSYISGIDSATSNRLIPWGITSTPEELYVQYTRTEE